MDGFYIDYQEEPLRKQAEWNPRVKKAIEEARKSFDEYIQEELQTKEVENGNSNSSAQKGRK